MAANFVELCRRAGVKPAKPLAEASRKRLFSQLGCEVPKEVAEFYAACNGGDLTAHKCRFYPLAEAVEMAGAWDFLVSFHLLPICEHENNASDPCMVGLDGPLAGYVFQICHDGPSGVRAPGIAAFLKELAAKKPGTFRAIERTSFTYPKALTAAEKKTVQKLIDRSKTELDDEPALLIELAMTMLTDDEFIDLMGSLKHPIQNARHDIESRLKRINKPAAKKALKGIEIPEKDLKAFVKEAVKRLKKAGMPAKTDAAGTALELEDDSINLETSYNVEELYQSRNSPDFWDWLLQDARSFVVGDEDEEDEEPPKPAIKLPKPMRPTLKLYEEVTSKLSWWGCDFCEDEELTEHPTLGIVNETADVSTPQKLKQWNKELGRLAMEQGWLVVPVEGPLKFQVVGPKCAKKFAK